MRHLVALDGGETAASERATRRHIAGRRASRHPLLGQPRDLGARPYRARHFSRGPAEIDQSHQLMGLVQASEGPTAGANTSGTVAQKLASSCSGEQDVLHRSGRGVVHPPADELNCVADHPHQDHHGTTRC